MHITSLTSNILSPTGAPWTLPLGRLVLLTGHNGRGKSAVNHAIRLAVAESTDDVNGKTMRDASDLFDLLSPFDGDGELFAHATFDTGVVAAWGTVREGDTVKHPTVELPSEVDPARCLPMRPVSQLFAGDPAAARAEVLRWIDASVTLDEVLVHIPGRLHEVYRTVAKAQPGAEVDKLSAVAEYAAAQVRQLEADATAQDELLAQLGNGLAARPSDAEVAEADNAVTAWTAAHLRAVAYEAAVAAQVQAPASAPQVSPDPAETFAKLQVERAEALAAIAAWDAHAAPPPGLETIQLRRQVLVGAQDQCQVCGTATGAEHLRHVDAYYAQQEANLTAAGATAAQAAQNAAGWRAALTKIDQSIAHCQWQMSMQAAPVAAPALAPLPENPGVSAADAAGSLEGWRALQWARTNTRAAWDQITKARDIAAAKRAEKPTYEQLRDACKAGVGSILGANKARFEARVQAYLPENWKFSLRLEKVLASGEVRPTCQPCLAIDGKPPRAYQSGAQRDGLMVALAMALADAGGAVAKDAKKKGKAKLNAAKFFLIVPGDRSRHPDNLGALMRAWSNFPGQVIIESAERPSGKMPAGWTHIDMDEVVKGWVQPQADVTVEQTAAPTRPDGTSWYYHGESDSYAALTYEQWSGSSEQGNLVFIGDDAAKAASQAKSAELRAATAAATAVLVAPPLPPPPPAAEPSQVRSPDVPSASETPQAPPPVEVSSSPASPAEAPPSDDRPLVLPGMDMRPEHAQALLMASYGWTAPKCAQVGPALLVELAKRRAYAARVLVVNPGHVELFDEKGAPAGTLRA